MRLDIVSIWVPPFRGFHLKPRGRAAMHLSTDFCVTLTLLNRMKARPSVRVYLIAVERQSALLAAVQVWTAGELVRMGSQDNAWRAVSMGVMLISHHPLSGECLPLGLEQSWTQSPFHHLQLRSRVCPSKMESCHLPQHVSQSLRTSG